MGQSLYKNTSGIHFINDFPQGVYELLSLWRIAARKLDQLDSVRSLDELGIPPGNRLEALQGSCAGQFSIRINQQYRLCFVWTEAGPEEVEIVDDH